MHRTKWYTFYTIFIILYKHAHVLISIFFSSSLLCCACSLRLTYVIFVAVIKYPIFFVVVALSFSLSHFNWLNVYCYDIVSKENWIECITHTHTGGLHIHNHKMRPLPPMKFVMYWRELWTEMLLLLLYRTNIIHYFTLSKHSENKNYISLWVCVCVCIGICHNSHQKFRIPHQNRISASMCAHKVKIS